MTTKELLRKALSLLLEGGWMQGAYSNGSGAYCSLGALRAAAGLLNGTKTYDEAPEYYSAVKRLGSVVYENQHFSDYQSGDIICWNDSGKRTEGDVLQAFVTAINVID